MSKSQGAAFLVVGPTWVGDMIMAQALFRYLHQQHPEAVIDVLAPDYTGALLQRMPEVRAHLASSFSHGELAINARLRLGKGLREKGYTQAYILPNSFKSALVPFAASVPRRTGFVGEFRYGLLNDARKLCKSELPLMVQRFIALACPIDARPVSELEIRANYAPVLLVDEVNQQEVRRELGLNTNQPLVIVCPGAEYGPAKRWPTHHFATLVQDLLKQGHQVVIAGSEKERSLAESILAAVGESEALYDLTGRTTLGQVIDLMASATVVISNDSGLMHVSAAVGVPVVALYGSSSPSFTPPLSDKVKVLSLDLDCRPCFQRTCPLKHTRCLEQLSPYQVLSAVDRVVVA